MTSSEERSVFTEKHSQSGFSLLSMSGQKNVIQSLLAIIIKRQLLEVKNCFRLSKPYFFYSLCRRRSKVKYILLCNEDIIKMWSHKRESDYNHCNRWSVYSADCITSCKACHCYPTADINFDISCEMTSSRILYLWRIWCQDWLLAWKSPLIVLNTKILPLLL